MTNHGTMVAHLNSNDAPQTVNNFVNLARHHYYDGLVFHRIIREFMIQGGCPEGSGRGGPGYRFADELPAPGRYKVGSLAMANAGPNTNGSQFFIVSGAHGVQLPPQYSLFGQLDLRRGRAGRDPEGPDRPLRPSEPGRARSSRSPSPRAEPGTACPPGPGPVGCCCRWPSPGERRQRAVVGVACPRARGC